MSARIDAAFLRDLAVCLTYNDTTAQAVAKHRLHEIAMRLDALAAPGAEAAAPGAVYLVATGETHEGRETYTRHDRPVPLADQETLYTAAPAAQPEPVTGALVGFSPMCLAPLDGTPVLLHMPTTTDKFAVGRWTDAHGGGWTDDEGDYYTHTPAAFMALSNLARCLGPAAQPEAPAQLTPGEALDQIQDAFEVAEKEDDAVRALTEEGWVWDGDQWQRPPQTEAAAVPAGWTPVIVNEGFFPLMEALARAHRKGYMPDAITDDYEGFDYRAILDAAPEYLK